MDRLLFVRDVCHLASNPNFAWRSSYWQEEGIKNAYPIKNGFCQTLISNRLFSWYRYYTRDGNAPAYMDVALSKRTHNAASIPPRSLITFLEWVPGVWPKKEETTGWFHFGSSSHHGIAYLSPNEEVTKHWSTHAKRHVKTFYKSGCTIREGTLKDVTADMLKSQVPKAMSIALAKITEYRLALSPETITIFVAEDKNNKRIGCFVCAQDAQKKESMYIMGYFLPEAKHLQPMSGLVHAWLTTLHANGYTAGNFGLMVGPHTTKLDPWWGLSQFKTHFGITRVHLPSGYGKIKIA